MVMITFVCDQCLGVAVGTFQAAQRVPDLNLLTSLPKEWIKMLPNPAPTNPDKAGRHLCTQCAEPIKKSGAVVNVSSN